MATYFVTCNAYVNLTLEVEAKDAIDAEEKANAYDVHDILEVNEILGLEGKEVEKGDY